MPKDPGETAEHSLLSGQASLAWFPRSHVLPGQGPVGAGVGWGGPADLALSPAQAEARPTGGTGAPAAGGSICKGGWLLPSVSSRPTQTPAAGMLAWKRSLGPLGPVLTGFGDGQGGSYALGKRI